MSQDGDDWFVSELRDLSDKGVSVHNLSSRHLNVGCHGEVSFKLSFLATCVLQFSYDMAGGITCNSRCVATKRNDGRQTGVVPRTTNWEAGRQKKLSEAAWHHFRARGAEKSTKYTKNFFWLYQAHTLIAQPLRPAILLISFVVLN